MDVPSAPLRRTIAAWLAGPAGTFLVNSHAARLPRELALSAGQRLLDIGCGRGTLLRLLDASVEFTRPPVGIDRSAALLRLGARDNAAAGASDPVLLAQAAPAALPFPGNLFDIVTCGYVLHTLDDDEVDTLFTEIYRVLRGGGLALLWEFAPSGSVRLDAWNRRWLGPKGASARLRSTRELVRMAHGAGFSFAQPARLHPFLFPPIPRASVFVGRPPEGYIG